MCGHDLRHPAVESGRRKWGSVTTISSWLSGSGHLALWVVRFWNSWAYSPVGLAPGWRDRRRPRLPVCHQMASVVGDILDRSLLVVGPLPGWGLDSSLIGRAAPDGVGFPALTFLTPMGIWNLEEEEGLT